MDPTEIRRELARMARDGSEPVDLIRWLHEEMGDRFSEFTMVAALFEVFDLPLLSVRRAGGWVGLSPNGYLSDDEVNELLKPLKLRDPEKWSH